MKKVCTVELVEQNVTKYVAEDGTGFEKKADCLKYERSLAVNELSVIETCTDAHGHPNFDGGECYESHDFVWYRPKNEHEINLLNKAYVDGHCKEFGYDMIGKWICVETDCGDDFVWVTTISDGITYAKELLSKLGYDMTITERSNGND